MLNGGITIGDKTLEIWPAGQFVESRGHETILMTQFEDAPIYHSGLREGVLARADDPNRSLELMTGLCGVKIYDIGDWNIPEASLINERAMALYRHALKCDEAVIDISWANVYRQRDYCMPHSHLRTRATVVYFLDDGDTSVPKSLDGRFCFVDPRIERCCKEGPGRMTTPFLPPVTPGTMIIFPSQLVHCVNPYYGELPRITMSWDIDQVRLPGAALPVARPES